MSKGEKGPEKVPAAEREARRAQALRANLQRRKAQTRARREEDADGDREDQGEA